MDHGPWTMEHGPGTIVHGAWSRDHCPWTIVHGPSFMDHRPWTMVHGPRTMDHAGYQKDAYRKMIANPYSKSSRTLVWSPFMNETQIGQMTHGPWSMDHGPNTTEIKRLAKTETTRYTHVDKTVNVKPGKTSLSCLLKLSMSRKDRTSQSIQAIFRKCAVNNMQE